MKKYNKKWLKKCVFPFITIYLIWFTLIYLKATIVEIFMSITIPFIMLSYNIFFGRERKKLEYFYFTCPNCKLEYTISRIIDL